MSTEPPILLWGRDRDLILMFRLIGVALAFRSNCYGWIRLTPNFDYKYLKPENELRVATTET